MRNMSLRSHHFASGSSIGELYPPSLLSKVAFSMWHIQVHSYSGVTVRAQMQRVRCGSATRPMTSLARRCHNGGFLKFIMQCKDLSKWRVGSNSFWLLIGSCKSFPSLKRSGDLLLPITNGRSLHETSIGTVCETEGTLLTFSPLHALPFRFNILSDSICQTQSHLIQICRL